MVAPIFSAGAETSDLILKWISIFGVLFFIFYTVWLEYRMKKAFRFIIELGKLNMNEYKGEFKRYKKELDNGIEQMKIILPELKTFLGIENQEPEIKETETPIKKSD